MLVSLLLFKRQLRSVETQQHMADPVLEQHGVKDEAVKISEVNIPFAVVVTVNKTMPLSNKPEQGVRLSSP